MEAEASSCRGSTPQSTSNRRRYNPEAGVGILTAIVVPTSVHIRIVEPARAILEPTPDLCCKGYNCRASWSSSWRLLTSAELLLSCSLCHRWISGGPVQMYRGGIGLCETEYRYDYITQEPRMRRA